MRIAKGACPVCAGNLYLDYKRRPGQPPTCAKCLACHRVFWSWAVKDPET